MTLWKKGALFSFFEAEFPFADRSGHNKRTEYNGKAKGPSIHNILAFLTQKPRSTHMFKRLLYWHLWVGDGRKNGFLNSFIRA